MAMTKLNEAAYRWIKEEIPDISFKDVDGLLSCVETVYASKRINAQDVKLQSWIPKKETVLELLNSQVRLVDIKYCIENFLTFAESRGWKTSDNLDAKFIGHIKIMLQSGKITLNEEDTV